MIRIVVNAIPLGDCGDLHYLERWRERRCDAERYQTKATIENYQIGSTRIYSLYAALSTFPSKEWPLCQQVAGDKGLPTRA